ncbi:ribonuclease P protein component [Altererythrobacter confluentis]|uniref:Ribonuclease P protein component n=1 Tax=Allopontixanthobacter confluentis TaxID=1849021 RepID=A0A6L7GHH9_9SPHN|nr:ribonuclease P protein component [Allopontixanthobacter confluentis]MXP15533.1 ribonuclease P protein component [Allopontixanthobacter confluentis]
MPPDTPIILTRRADFLAANRGLRVARRGFVLLAHPNDGKGTRYGITVTKKIGNAVVRNRMKRRFRALLRDALPARGLADHDLVLIGREGGVERDFGDLHRELARALEKAALGQGDPPRSRSGRHRGKPKPGQRSGGQGSAGQRSSGQGSSGQGSAGQPSSGRAK